MRSHLGKLFGVLTIIAWAPAATAADFRDVETMRQSAVVLQQVMATPDQGIPRHLFSKAQAVAIFPRVKGGAIVIGIRKGRGVMVTRDESGQWQLPHFVEIAGGSVGWQAGIQSTDVILVFRSRESLGKLMRGKLTVGADASVAAGPLGRQVAAATDVALSSEIFSYSRSRGIFLGVSLDGSVLRPDLQADASFYQQPRNPGQPAAIPAVAGQLVDLIGQYSGGPDMPVATAPAPQPEPAQADPLAQQMTEAWQQLAVLLPPDWQQYLAPPAVASVPGAAGFQEALEAALQRYETVFANPQYSGLAARPEFQSVYRLLRQAVQQQAAIDGGGGHLQLPPPPSTSRSSGPALTGER